MTLLYQYSFALLYYYTEYTAERLNPAVFAGSVRARSQGPGNTYVMLDVM
jgi:hypothetical protein